jgi:lipopolysaccharide transport system ATP-binding protein
MTTLSVENLGRRYVLPGVQKDAPESDRSSSWMRFWKSSKPADQEFWALRDVSFNVEPGTILGIIGPNGAGKSTLLKILARVTTPTTGVVRGSGRVVSLLELGAGFDPELNARDNVIMNAAMQGIRKSEALSRLPQIMEFAGIDQFSATPLRHYSSGMYLRLAFSVAVNMQPKILLADEILAVGDLAFQERCLQKVEESGRDGLIVLFVSHDMEAIARVCNRVLWLQKGQVQRIGDPEDVISDYQDAVWADDDASRFERGRSGSRFAAIRGVKLLSAAGKEIGAAPTDEDVQVAIVFEAFKAVSVKGAIDLHARKQLLFRATDPEFRPVQEPGLYEARVRVPAGLLTDISYQVTASITTLREGQLREYRLVAYNALSFMAYHRTETTAPIKGRAPKTGLLAPRLQWSMERHDVAVGV